MEILFIKLVYDENISKEYSAWIDTEGNLWYQTLFREKNGESLGGSCICLDTDEKIDISPKYSQG